MPACSCHSDVIYNHKFLSSPLLVYSVDHCDNKLMVIINLKLWINFLFVVFRASFMKLNFDMFWKMPKHFGFN